MINTRSLWTQILILVKILEYLRVSEIYQTVAALFPHAGPAPASPHRLLPDSALPCSF